MTATRIIHPEWPPTPTPECIYCRSTTGTFKKGEHVLPKAFGTFGPTTWVLRGVVCDECNQYFGDNLEVVFTRGSWEALARFQHGLKPSSESKDLRLDRIAAVSTSEPSKGIQFDPLTREVLPQARLLRDAHEEEWESFSLPELKSKASLDLLRYRKGEKTILAYGNNQEDIDQILAELKRLGIKMAGSSPGPQLPPHNVIADCTFVIDRTSMRTMAKVAFNYLTHERGAQYALRSDFNSVRSYIRYGENTPFPATVVPSNEPIILNDGSKRRVLGHIAVLERRDNGSTIQARVSFFNSITYTITLARFFSGRNMPSIGHFFNFPHKQILPLKAL